MTAYCIEKESVMWHYNSTQITKVFVFSQFVIAIRSGRSIIKLDIHNGRVIEEIVSTSIENAFYLDREHLLVDSIRGKVCIVAVQGLYVLKNYKKQVINPNCCLSLVIQNAFVRDSEIIISGFEEYPYKNIKDTQKYFFDRIIDNF